MRAFARALVVAAVLGAAIEGRAEGKRVDEVIQRAREFYRTGMKAFDLGKYDEAIENFENAYRLKDSPGLLYNIGQAYRLAGNPEQALHAYKSYLARAPNPPNLDDVDAKIVAMEKLVEQRQLARELALAQAAVAAATPTTSPLAQTTLPVPAAVPPPAPTPPPVSSAPAAAVEATPPGAWMRPAAYASGGMGAAALIGGVLYAFKARSVSSAMSAAASGGQRFDPALETSGKQAQSISAILLGAGVLGLAGATTFYLLGEPPPGLSLPEHRVGVLVGWNQGGPATGAEVSF